jgi:ATP-binding cassette subfamily F protein 3
MTTARVEDVQWRADAISVRSLDLSVGDKHLLTGATFQIRREERVALMGRNGCGKSSLFQWLRTSRPGGVGGGAGVAWSVYEVTQELATSEDTVTNVVLSAHLERGALWARQAALEAKDDLTDAEAAEYQRIGEQLTAMRADADPPRVRKILHGLGFRGTEMDRPLSAFSGGWRARVALAMGLFMEPDLLLLDEPTNHLDLEGVLWLTEFLKVWPKALVVISHNVGFIREVATTQWLIQCGQLACYRCSYARFLQQRALDTKKIEKDWAILEKEVASLRGKGTPDAKKAAETLFAKRIREGVVRPARPYRPTFHFVEGGTGGAATTALLKTTGSKLGYGDRVVLDDVTFALYKGTRAALVGANGSGKTTLLRFLSGELAPLEGDSVVESRTGLRILKFDQHFYHTLPLTQTPLDYITSVAADGVGAHAIRRILGASGLESSEHTQVIGTLSGGQKARVYFAAIAAQRPDILLMDEPTNHLDMETVTGLTAGLCDFPGAVILVSHDLDFLESVATEVWQTTDGRLVALRGEVEEGLSAYVESVVAEMEV